MTTHSDTTGTTDEQYVVVRNFEEQYSIWRADMTVPDGWSVISDPASKSECLEQIGRMWTDMRPASLRRSMGTAAHG